jgi:hypothetical protein
MEFRNSFRMETLGFWPLRLSSSLRSLSLRQGLESGSLLTVRGNECCKKLFPILFAHQAGFLDTLKSLLTFWLNFFLHRSALEATIGLVTPAIDGQMGIRIFEPCTDLAVANCTLFDDPETLHIAETKWYHFEFENLRWLFGTC